MLKDILATFYWIFYTLKMYENHTDVGRFQCYNSLNSSLKQAKANENFCHYWVLYD